MFFAHYRHRARRLGDQGDQIAERRVGRHGGGGLKQGIVDNKVSYGVILGALSVAMGILNAGALTG